MTLHASIVENLVTMLENAHVEIIQESAVEVEAKVAIQGNYLYN